MSVRNLITLFVLTLALCAAGQWEKSLEAGALVTTNNYSDNWEGGEAGSFNWTLSLSAMAQKPLTDWLHNQTTLKLAFGQSQTQDAESHEWSGPTKSDDLIDLESVFRFTLGGFVDPYASLRGESQFYDRRVAGNYRYFNPVMISEGAGVSRVFIKKEKRELTARLGASFRQEIDRDVMVGDEHETQTTNDGGAELIGQFRTPLAGDRISYRSRLGLYRAFFNSESEDLDNDHWKVVDVDWEHRFTANITEYIMVNLDLEILYDREIDPSARHKEIISLGITYKL